MQVVGQHVAGDRRNRVLRNRCCVSSTACGTSSTISIVIVAGADGVVPSVTVSENTSLSVPATSVVGLVSWY